MLTITVKRLQDFRTFSSDIPNLHTKFDNIRSHSLEDDLPNKNRQTGRRKRETYIFVL